MAPGALVHVRGVRLAVMHVSLWLMTKTFREDVNKVLEDRFSELQRLFVFSCSKATGGQRDRSSGRLLDLAGWDRLLRKCNMFSSSYPKHTQNYVFLINADAIWHIHKQSVTKTSLITDSCFKFRDNLWSDL